MWNTVFKKFEVMRCVLTDRFTSNFLKAVFHKFYLVHSWISAGPYAQKKKCPTYLYLLKAIFCVNKILGAKIGENGGWQHFYPTHSQKYDVIIFTVSEIFFSKYLDSLASNWKISLTGEKNSQKLWSENFFFRRYYSLNDLQNTDQ